MSRRPEQPHGPNTLQGYLSAHLGAMDHWYEVGFVGDDNLDMHWVGRRHLQIRGHIACWGRILIAVHKTLVVADSANELDFVEPRPCQDATPRSWDGRHQGNRWTQTRLYSYNAWLRGGRTFLRNDNADHWVGRGGHVDAHHRHVYDDDGRQVNGSPFWVGAARWPTLGDFIGDVYIWWNQNQQRLVDPFEHSDVEGLRTPRFIE